MPTVLVQGLLLCRTHNSSLATAVTITSIHFAYTRRDDKVELARVAWLNTKMVYSTRKWSPISVLTQLNIE